MLWAARGPRMGVANPFVCTHALVEREMYKHIGRGKLLTSPGLPGRVLFTCSGGPVGVGIVG